ncbi:MAG: hypothetical protein FWB74_06210 [Defluviitaleaceae bacterium]|nr:hypothetical protein [Defluviitaleaceae bacterium]
MDASLNLPAKEQVQVSKNHEINYHNIDEQSGNIQTGNAQHPTSTADLKPLTTYFEKKIGKNLFRVTSIYTGKIDLAKALEDLTVKKILQEEKALRAADISNILKAPKICLAQPAETLQSSAT